MQDPFADFEHDPRDPAYAALRASDRDRDRLLPVLAEAYAEGRLSREEHDDRVTTLTASRTLGELPAVVADLAPAPSTATAPPARRTGSSGDVALRAEAESYYVRQRREAVWGAISASVVCLLIWALSGFGFFWPGLVVLGTALNVGRIVYTRDDVVADRIRALEKKQRRSERRSR